MDIVVSDLNKSVLANLSDKPGICTIEIKKTARH